MIRALRAARRHALVQNAAALYVQQFAVSVLPLVTLPIIARALGPGGLADVVLAQSCAWLLGVVVAYGFDLSGARDVARARHDPAALTGVLGAVLGAQVVLVGLAALGAVAMTLALPQFRADLALPAFALALGVLSGAQPHWFLTGVERLRAQAAIDVAVLVLNAAAIVLLVRDEDDAHVVLAVLTAGAALTAVLKLRIVARSAPLVRPRLRAGLAQLRRGVHLFLSSVGQSLFSTGNVFLLGLLVAGPQLAFFASAERVVRATSRFVPPIAFAVFPRVTALLARGAEERAERLAGIALVALAALGVGVAGALVLLAEPIVLLVFGDAFRPAVPILRTLALILPLGAVSAALSSQFLIPRGRDRAVSACLLGAGALNIVAAVLVVPSEGVASMAWVLVGVEACLAIALALVLRSDRRQRARAAG